MAHRNLFSERVNNGDHEYTLNIVEGINSKLYLIISNSTASGDESEQKRFRIPVQDLGCVRDALNRIIEYIADINPIQTHEDDIIIPDPKNYTLDDIRKEHPHAYLPWSAEDDEKLEKLFCEGRSTKELAIVFERNMGAITSRIKKLELRDKYK